MSWVILRVDGKHNMVPIQPTQKKPLMSRAWKFLSVLHEWWQASTYISPSVDVQQQMQDNPKVLETNICCNHADSPFTYFPAQNMKPFTVLLGRNNIKQVKHFISEHGKNIKLVIYEVMCSWIGFTWKVKLPLVYSDTHRRASFASWNFPWLSSELMLFILHLQSAPSLPTDTVPMQNLTGRNRWAGKHEVTARESSVYALWQITGLMV